MVYVSSRIYVFKLFLKAYAFDTKIIIYSLILIFELIILQKWTKNEFSVAPLFFTVVYVHIMIMLCSMLRSIIAAFDIILL